MNLFDNIVKQSGVSMNTPTHVILYDLPNGTSDNIYTNLWNSIKALGPYARPLISSWTIRSQSSCQEILNILLPVINHNGKLHVTNIHTGEIQKYGIDDADSVLQPALLKKKDVLLAKSIVTRKLT